jgi:hypothetical protein
MLPLADLFMLAMLSRPATGSLRNTWVTPATLYMCAAVALAGVPLGAVLVVYGRGGGTRTALALGIIVLLLAAGACSVAIVGASQRVIERRS